MKKYLIILAVIILIGGIAGYFFYKRTPEISYKTAKIERGTIVSTVAATGNLSAVTTVQVGTQVSGTIQKLYVDYNSRVKKGQAIAEIDPSLFNASVEQSQGNFLNAEANLQKAKVTLADAERTFNRNKKLLSDGIISQGDFDVAETAFQSAKAAVKAAEGSVAQTRGALMQSRTNLRYSVIRSPVDGVVISRAIDVGQTVAASFPDPDALHHRPGSDQDADRSQRRRSGYQPHPASPECQFHRRFLSGTDFPRQGRPDSQRTDHYPECGHLCRGR